MVSFENKLLKKDGKAPTDVEASVAKALFDLESNVNDLKADLRPLQIQGVREIEIKSGRKSLVVEVPPPLLKQFHKIQPRLVRELEKKFSDRHVVFIAKRTMIPKPTRRSRKTQQRPRSRTLTAVHDNLLEDLVYPTEIVGKRCRTKTDGTKLYRVFLDSKDKNILENKLDTFVAIYKKLTGKDIIFEFQLPVQEVEVKK